MYIVEYAYNDTFDLDELYEAYTRAINDLALYRDEPGTKEDVMKSIQLFLPNTTLDDRCLFVATDEDGYIVGLLVGLVSPNLLNPSRRIANEMLLWVDKEHRKSSLARRLIKAYEDWARWAKCSDTTLSCYQDNDSIYLDRFYKVFGYNPVETTYTKRIDK